MADETLFTAARRLVRFIRIDDAQHGGLLHNETVQAADTLDKQVRLEELRLKAAEAAAATDASAGAAHADR